MFLHALQPEPEAGRRCRVLVPGALLTAALFWIVGTASRSPSLQFERPAESTIRVQIALPEPVPLREPTPDVPPEPEPAKVKERPTPAPKDAAPKQAMPQVEPNPEPPPPATEPSQVVDAAEPVNPAATVTPPLVGIHESASPLAAGPALPTGNTWLAGVHPVARATRAAEKGPAGAVNPASDESNSKRRTEPKLQFSVLPAYPSEARRAGVEGVVILLLNIDARGAVQSVRVLKGLGHGLDESAVRAAKQTRWQPATLGRAPVQSTRAFNVRFSLQS